MNTVDFWSEVWAIARAKWYLRHRVQLGRRTRLFGRVVLRNQGVLIIGRAVRLVGDIVPIELFIDRGGTLEIGDCTFINYGCSIGATLSVQIGSRCNLGPYCNLIDNSFHRLEPDRRNDRPDSAPVILGENVWLSGRVIVLPGVTIGSNSVIGAGSIVTQSIPPNVLATGAPAKVVRTL